MRSNLQSRSVYQNSFRSCISIKEVASSKVPNSRPVSSMHRPSKTKNHPKREHREAELEALSRSHVSFPRSSPVCFSCYSKCHLSSFCPSHDPSCHRLVLTLSLACRSLVLVSFSCRYLVLLLSCPCSSHFILLSLRRWHLSSFCSSPGVSCPPLVLL